MPYKCLIEECLVGANDDIKMYHLPNPMVHLKAFNLFKPLFSPHIWKNTRPIDIYRNYNICEHHFKIHKDSVFLKNALQKQKISLRMEVAKNPQKVLEEYLELRHKILGVPSAAEQDSLMLEDANKHVLNDGNVVLNSKISTDLSQANKVENSTPTVDLTSFKQSYNQTISRCAAESNKYDEPTSSSLYLNENNPENKDASNTQIISILSKNVKNPDDKILIKKNSGSAHGNNSTKSFFSSQPVINVIRGTDNIVWMDMEMTGLDIDNDHILEVACMITNSDLEITAIGPHLIIHQPKSILDNMNDWCKKFHGETGLTEASLNSNISLKEAASQILEFLERHLTEKSSPLAGNSIYMDRLFLRKYMPDVDNYLHYRIIDVSTIKEVCKKWNFDLYKQVPEKKYEHRALNDIVESIEEMRFYKNNFFKCN